MRKLLNKNLNENQSVRKPNGRKKKLEKLKLRKSKINDEKSCEYKKNSLKENEKKLKQQPKRQLKARKVVCLLLDLQKSRKSSNLLFQHSCNLFKQNRR